MSFNTIAISTVQGPGSSLFPVLHPPSGSPAVCTSRLGHAGLRTMLPAAILNQAILMTDNSDAVTVLIEKHAVESFRSLSLAWQHAITTRQFPEVGRLVNIPGGAWKLILELPRDNAGDGVASVRAYQHFARQSHVNKRGYGLWIPGFAIDATATQLPAIHSDILARLKGDDAGKARQELKDWFWNSANPALEDPFVEDAHPELGLLSEITWKRGSLDALQTTFNHIFWSDELFAEHGMPAELELACLIDHDDEPRELRFVKDVACDDKRLRQLLIRAITENQPVCHRICASTSRISGLAPGRTALSITIDPPSAHQVIEAEAAMESWLRKRGL